jgi:enterochelin esterase family protein
MRVSALRLVLITALLVVASRPAQTDAGPESSMLAAVLRDVSSGTVSAQNDFWKMVAEKGAPLIEKIPGNNGEVLATFVWKDSGETHSVILSARINGADPVTEPRNQMRRLKGTNIWYLSCRLPVDAEFPYTFLVNLPQAAAGPSIDDIRNATRLDPLNPMTYPDKSDPLFNAAQPWRAGSIASMPAVPPNPWLERQSGVARGTLHDDEVNSAFLTKANPRRIWVYMPPDAVTRIPYVLILFDGGTTYQFRIPTMTILDNLYAAKKIAQTVTVFVDTGADARDVDLTFSDMFNKFLADELLPMVERKYRFTTDAAHTVLGGDSLGGLAGAYAVLRRPDAFGRVLSQSGAFQFKNINDAKDSDEPEWLARQFLKAPPTQASFYLEVGRMEDRPEGSDGTTLLASNRHLRDVLQAKGYTVHYAEVYGDHNPVHWRRMLPDALIAMLRAN